MDKSEIKHQAQQADAARARALLTRILSSQSSQPAYIIQRGRTG